jgi:hypothetical protein
MASSFLADQARRHRASLTPQLLRAIAFVVGRLTESVDAILPTH